MRIKLLEELLNVLRHTLLAIIFIAYLVYLYRFGIDAITDRNILWIILAVVTLK
jgi:hypothetical protein